MIRFGQVIYPYSYSSSFQLLRILKNTKQRESCGQQYREFTCKPTWIHMTQSFSLNSSFNYGLRILWKLAMDWGHGWVFTYHKNYGIQLLTHKKLPWYWVHANLSSVNPRQWLNLKTDSHMYCRKDNWENEFNLKHTLDRTYIGQQFYLLSASKQVCIII